MNERLFSYAILFKCELISQGSFEQYLNDMFLKYLDNELLLELQWASIDANKVIQTIFENISKDAINHTVFGQILLNELERIYLSKELDLQAFASKSYAVWQLLPDCMGSTEPFSIMSYADDPLSWGDEQQTCSFYEKMFNFYKVEGD